MKINTPWEFINDSNNCITITDSEHNEVCQIFVEENLSEEDYKRAELICKLVDTYGQVIADEIFRTNE